jgi:CHRD domain
MKRHIALLALVVLLSVQGSARSDFIATATLTGDGESNSPGTGFGTVTFNSATDSLSIMLTFSGLTSPVATPSGVPGPAHIHFGQPGVEGPIIFPFLDFPTGGTSGIYSTTLTAANLMPDPPDGINTFTDAVNAIAAGDTYFNIHTVAFPGGEIRGQITAVPEPAGLTLLALGLGGALAFPRFGRRRAA